MNMVTTVFVLIAMLIIAAFAGHQIYGTYSVKACAEITKSLGSDYRQCFSGKINGIVGIDLEVKPIAYKIARHKKRFHDSITRWNHARVSKEILGVRAHHKFHLSVKDEELASIAYEIDQYTHSLKQDSNQIQSYESYENLKETAPTKKKRKEFIVKEYNE